MRTKKCLGYVVFGLVRKARGIYNFVLVVQSDVQSTNHIVNENKQFLKDWQTKLAEMSEEDFQKLKEGCIAKVSEKYLNMGQMHNDHCDELENKEFAFNRKDLKE